MHTSANVFDRLGLGSVFSFPHTLTSSGCTPSTYSVIYCYDWDKLLDQSHSGYLLENRTVYLYRSFL